MTSVFAGEIIFSGEMAPAVRLHCDFALTHPMNSDYVFRLVSDQQSPQSKIRQIVTRNPQCQLAFFGCALTLLSGCARIGTSRWAMDDEVYAQKYDKPYPSNDADKVARMMKQAGDARYVAERGGWYIGGAAADEPTALGAEIGVFQYQCPSIETRAGLKGLLGTGADDWFAGVDLGLRAQSPSRFAPFAGIGTYLGGNNRKTLAIHDHRDNDGDGSVDERGEMKDDGRFLASFYPELGAHFWLNSSTRLTGSAQYHLTTDGRDSDFWFIGFSIAFLGGPDEYEPAAE